MIDDTITDGHSVVTVDVDGDGRDEVVAGPARRRRTA